MTEPDFIRAMEALVESQGSERFAALALDELGITYVDEVEKDHRQFILRRVVALWEEAQ